MSTQGANYFHTEDPGTLHWLARVIAEAAYQGQSVRIYTEGTRLYIKRGEGVWSSSLASSPDPHRDV